MRLYALYLTGALVATAIPLSAGAQPVQATRQTAAGAEQTTPTLDACGLAGFGSPPVTSHLADGRLRVACPVTCARAERELIDR